MPETVVQPSEEVLLRSWEEFLRKYYKARLNEVALEYPQERSLEVDYWDLDRHSPQLAEFLLERPTAVLYAAEKSVEAIDVASTSSEPLRLHVRVKHLPEQATVKIRDLRSVHLGKLLAIEGLVKRASGVGPRIEDALFKCLRCDAVIQEPQDEHMVLKEPLQCYEDQGGCGHSSGFKLLTEKSRFIDSQHLEIQESPESLRGGEQPQRLALFVEDDICGRVAPGDRIVAIGILRATPKKQGNTKSTLFQLHLQIVAIEVRQQAYTDIHISPEEEVEIARLSKDPGLYDQLVRSMAPTIFGMETEKEAMVMQLFGGVEKKINNSRIRGDIHILMVGDPGVAKSQMLRYAARIHPRGIYTSGKSSSAAGLTAAAVRDEVEGRWTLEAGAMVLADRGLACIDEMDKMTEEDRSAMHEALEQGTVSIAKAGITASLNSRCSVLGAANPKDGRFDTKYGSIAEQIDMPPALMSRFDVIFPMTDKPHAERDGALANFILGVHKAGEIHEYRNVHGDQGLYSAGDEEGAMVRVEPPIEEGFLRKYVAYARIHCFPVLTTEAQGRIRDYYVDLRRQSGGDDESGPIAMTPRQLEALVRLSEASARVRLSHEAGMEDVDRAIRIVEYYLRKVAPSEDGKWDIDKIASGVSHNQRDRIHKLIVIVDDVGRTSDQGAHIDQILEKARAQGMSDQDVRADLERLVTTSRLYQPRGHGTDYYKKV